MNYPPLAPAATLPYPRASEGVLAAGWHNFDDIVTLTGLAGTFYWPENPLLPTQITFTFNPGMEGFQGTYVIRFGLTVIEQGNLFSVPNNPAIGFAAITLMPTGSMTSRTFIVSGMFTDAADKIFFLLLTAISVPTPVQPVFVPFRIA